MIIGAHVSTTGGLQKAVSNGREIGAEAIQIFPSAPMRWKISGWSEDECRDFKQKWPQYFHEVIFHGIYLINLAANLGQNYHLSKVAVIETIILAAKMGITKVVIHPGSYINEKIGNKEKIKIALKKIMDSTPSDVKLVFENSAGSTIGGKLEDLSWLIEQIPNKNRTGICLDTCHAYAAGYDIVSEEGYRTFTEELKRLFGKELIACWHFNDSKFGFGEKKDRHENIGQGKIPLTVFERIINDSTWQNLAAYLEVPGLDGKGPDKDNVEILKGLRQKTEIGRERP